MAETPQDAQAERRERWRAAMHADMTASLSDLMGSDPHAPAIESQVMDHCMALSDEETRREQAVLVVKYDRLRAGIEALATEWDGSDWGSEDVWGEGYDSGRERSAAELRDLLATPDADAQDEGVRRGE